MSHTALASHLPDARTVPACRPARATHRAAHDRSTYTRLLAWAFTLFNSVRVFAYLPTLWAVLASGDSSQHSLWTWGTWMGANLTMAAWLYEQNGQRIDRTVCVNACNALMCAMVLAVISWQRL